MMVRIVKAGYTGTWSIISLATNVQDADEHIKQYGIYTMTAYRNKEVFLFLGGGDNGKSSFIKILDRIHAISQTYGSIDIDKKSIEKNQFIGENIYNKLVVVCREFDEGSVLPEKFLKEITGNEGFGFNIKNQNVINGINTAVVIILTNDIPVLQGQKMDNRLIAVPFGADFSEGSIYRDEELDMLVRDTDHIACIVEKAIHALSLFFTCGSSWHNHAVMPQCAIDKTAETFSEGNILRKYINKLLESEYIEFDDTFTCPTISLQDLLKKAGYKLQKGFNTRMMRLGYGYMQNKRVRIDDVNMSMSFYNTSVFLCPKIPTSIFKGLRITATGWNVLENAK